MLDNPQIWINDFIDYIEKPSLNVFEYGMVCTINKDAPKQAQNSYLKYIDLVKRNMRRLGLVVIDYKNMKVKKFECNDSKHQFLMDIANSLLKAGIISDDLSKW